MSFVQREHYRVPINVPVKVDLDGISGLEGICQNISMGGMGLSLKGDIPPKSCGMVRMRYDQEESKILFSAKFSVAWTRSEDPDPTSRSVGIQFVEVDENNQTNLVQILVKRLKELEGTSTDSH
jgi:c-di-GMP-binding flagellar brake protein YcgR